MQYSTELQKLMVTFNQSSEVQYIAGHLSSYKC